MQVIIMPLCKFHFAWNFGLRDMNSHIYKKYELPIIIITLQYYTHIHVHVLHKVLVTFSDWDSYY